MARPPCRRSRAAARRRSSGRRRCVARVGAFPARPPVVQLVGAARQQAAGRRALPPPFGADRVPAAGRAAARRTPPSWTTWRGCGTGSPCCADRPVPRRRRRRESSPEPTPLLPAFLARLNGAVLMLAARGSWPDRRPPAAVLDVEPPTRPSGPPPGAQRPGSRHAGASTRRRWPGSSPWTSPRSTRLAPTARAGRQCGTPASPGPGRGSTARPAAAARWRPGTTSCCPTTPTAAAAPDRRPGAHARPPSTRRGVSASG